MSAIKAEHELKGLQSQLIKAEAELKTADEDLQAVKIARGVFASRVNGLKQKIAAFYETQKEPTITEHAILRYIERVIGINLEEIKAKILSGQVREMIQKLGSGKFPADGFRVVVKNGTVITVEE